MPFSTGAAEYEAPGYGGAPGYEAVAGYEAMAAFPEGAPLGAGVG